MGEKKIETGLIREGTAKFGKALLEEAAQYNQDKLQKVVVSTIGELLIQVDEQRRAVKTLENMVAALQAGAFELNKNGQITYTDPELNEAVRWISHCGQCGYEKIVKANHRGEY